MTSTRCSDRRRRTQRSRCRGDARASRAVGAGARGRGHSGRRRADDGIDRTRRGSRRLLCRACARHRVAVLPVAAARAPRPRMGPPADPARASARRWSLRGGRGRSRRDDRRVGRRRQDVSIDRRTARSSLRRSHRRRAGTGGAHAPPSVLLHPLRYQRGATGRGRWPGDSRPTRGRRCSPDARRTRCCRFAACSPRRSGCCCSPARTHAAGRSPAAVRSASPTRWWPGSSSSAAASNAVVRCGRSPTCHRRERRCSIRRRGNWRGSPATRCPSGIAGASNRSATDPVRSRSTTCSTKPVPWRVRGLPSRRARSTSAALSRRSRQPRPRSLPGKHADKPFVLVAQPSVADDARSPAWDALALGLRPRSEWLDARSDRGRRASDRAIRAGLSRCRARSSGDPGRAVRGLQRQLHRRRHRGRRPRDEPIDRSARSSAAHNYRTPNPQLFLCSASTTTGRWRSRHVRIQRRPRRAAHHPQVALLLAFYVSTP